MLKLVVALALPVIAVVGWGTYLARKVEYWDEEVRKLCAQGGGVKVFERVVLTDRRYLDADMNIRIPPKLEHLPGYGPLPFEARPDDLYFRQSTLTVIHAERPHVARSDSFLFRTGDNKLLGQATSFARVGGDLIPTEVGSRLRCPVNASESDLFKKVFIVDAALERKP